MGNDDNWKKGNSCAGNTEEKSLDMRSDLLGTMTGPNWESAGAIHQDGEYKRECVEHRSGGVELGVV